MLFMEKWYLIFTKLNKPRPVLAAIRHAKSVFNGLFDPFTVGYQTFTCPVKRECGGLTLFWTCWWKYPNTLCLTLFFFPEDQSHYVQRNF